ncbi:MAG: pseudouridine synthase [Candidatus Raymondbacteria bacterium RifOxyA12_full_50_37]|uniref:Pseudouridine synthase n=1 Tax=Candidatus Raymondbacteria bacterium RIFOXYD12_FULL_49_13 TaxID=1817890 RepID=A0A1F7FID4_UNCRA|nr:MAG: pseudouridine synthase [Candidatus Raymondbacteria bacterium RifOxyA12_full_50_37]OGJ91350.1 MAG: pseudouridine synthase [Candidatus Raymondbacteria bacterium RIFOXYA2_FULL_49_16]OGJ97745.1 MAG: pseudouridine synthase [Candidatus Raymondbacteria bacterium RIFOXYC2_FULL_50_21]OGK00153.1 MAG: pseudouridine synthase [Candidatus Raymondbacteria bacterium RifOxyC12_full_50_8]OGK06393.1 MAG: pseudouridine synthase [Candidatus Raymondbacteria bacterium RIFOXYD12_FULL_49_13]OGP43740.1 MAG: pse
MINCHKGLISLPRALSKLGHCSRTQAETLIAEGRVRVNGKTEHNAKIRIDLKKARIFVDGKPIATPAKIYLMLYKSRGLVTTASDEQGRDTVYACLADAGLPWLSPVGRLDRASEGLLLFTNDTRWASRVTDPETHLDKTYHVQIDRVADTALCDSLVRGVPSPHGGLLAAKQAAVLRQGEKNSWLKIVLDEGKNRQIRRMLSALSIEVLRLIRVAIGPLKLGDLEKGKFRYLTSEEAAIM